MSESRYDDTDDRCEYCGMRISAEVADRVPEVDDEAGWAELAREHAEWCDWIATRAFARRDDLHQLDLEMRAERGDDR